MDGPKDSTFETDFRATVLRTVNFNPFKPSTSDLNQNKAIFSRGTASTERFFDLWFDQVILFQSFDFIFFISHSDFILLFGRKIF